MQNPEESAAGSETMVSLEAKEMIMTIQLKAVSWEAAIIVAG